MQALGSFARAAVTGALATLGHVAADEHAPPVRVPAVAETGYVGANAICAAANKQFDEYLNRRTTKAYFRALVKEGTVADAHDLIHDHHAEGPFVHPKVALHLAEWANPAFMSVVNGWVLRYVAADRTLAEDILRRAGAAPGDTLGSTLTHTIAEVPPLLESTPRDEYEFAGLSEGGAGGSERPHPLAEAPPVALPGAPPPPLPRRKQPARGAGAGGGVEEEGGVDAAAAAAAWPEAPAGRARAPRAAKEKVEPPAAAKVDMEMEEEEEEEEEAGGAAEQVLPPITPAAPAARATRAAAPTPPTAAPPPPPPLRRAAKTPVTKAPRKFPPAAAKKTAGRRRRKTESYKIYIYKVLKQVHPELGISAKGMAIMNSMMSDMFERIVEEATKLMAKDKTLTLGARELAAAVKLHFTGDLRSHAMSEGAKAVAKARE